MPRVPSGKNVVPLDDATGVAIRPVWGLNAIWTAILDDTPGMVLGPRLSPSKPPPNDANGA
jgi:hypothetical protein